MIVRYRTFFYAFTACFVSENVSFTIRSKNDEISDFSIELYDEFGRKINSAKSGFNSYIVTESPSAAGIYFASIQYVNYLGEELIVTKKISVQ